MISISRVMSRDGVMAESPEDKEEAEPLGGRPAEPEPERRSSAEARSNTKRGGATARTSSSFNADNGCGVSVERDRQRLTPFGRVDDTHRDGLAFGQMRQARGA